MLVFSAEETHKLLPYGALIDEIARAFQGSITAPPRHHHTLKLEDNDTDATLLLMPAWHKSEGAGVKIVSVNPDNMKRSLPAISGLYIYLDGITLEPRALFDGAALTVRRTAATSALASRFLSRNEAKTLLMVGTGALAPHLIRAHACVRPLERVLIWGRTPDKASALAADLSSEGIGAEAVSDLATATVQADIISCATLSRDPLILGTHVRPGCHVDLVGAYRPDMRESDDQLVKSAENYVDTYEGALSEGGDLVQPMASGLISSNDIKADLAELCVGRAQGRTDDRAITLFKSVGASLEDFAAAAMAYRAYQEMHG